MDLDINAIVREHGSFVWRVLRHLGVAEAQLHDASQEVFMVVFQQRATFAGRSSLRTWLYGICRNVAYTEGRRRQRRKERVCDEPPDVAVDPSQQQALWLQQAHAMLVDALAQLTEESRAVFVLYEIEEVRMEDIASELGIPITTAYSRLYLAREKVQAAVRRRQIAPKRAESSR